MWDPREDSYIQELAARVEALEAAQQQPQLDQSLAPPIGVKPQWLVDEERLGELEAAIKRYEDRGVPVLIDWVVEASEIRDRQQQRRKDLGLREKVDLIVQVEEHGQQPDHIADASKMVDTGWQDMADGSPIMEPAPPAQQPPQSVPPAEIFPVEYADSDGDGIRILMEPADETGRVCWVVRNSRHVNPCHEFPSPEDAYAAHRRAQPAPAPPEPVEGLVERVAKAMGPSSQASMDAGDLPYGSARAAIREIAAATDQMAPDRNLTWERVALWLEQEAER